MFENNLTTVSQGSVGLASAIFKLTQLGYIVSVPLNDNQPYDLVVDIGDSFLYKIDVKTTKAKGKSGFYEVQIRKVRPNRSGNTIHHFDNTVVDFLFVYTADDEYYFIPCTEITTKALITLNANYEKFKV